MSRVRNALCLGVAAISLAAGVTAAGAAKREALPLDDVERAEIRELMATSPFDQGVWGMQVVDVKTGRALFRLNSRRKFQAASTTKNFTVAAGLEFIGADRLYRTPVVHTGEVTGNGRLDGDLILRASGDLTMGGRHLPGNEVAYTGFDHTDSNEVPGPATLTPQDPLRGLNQLARQVRDSGIERVGGRVTIDDRLWEAERVGKEMISPIVINDNMIDVTMTPTGPGEAVETSTRPRTDAYSVDVQVRTVEAGGALDLEVGDVEDGRAVITGTIPADSGPIVQVVRVPDPAFFARSLFVDALERAGVDVAAKSVAPNKARSLPSRKRVDGLPRLARITSPAFSEFGKLCLKVSHNLVANTIPFLIGLETSKPKLEVGLDAIRRFATEAGVRKGELKLVDGQGSSGNLISPRAQVDLLTHVAEQPYAEKFLDALPVKGVDGLPENPESDPSTGHVFEKNGLTGAEDENGDIEVQAMALAGYVRAEGRELAFDLVANDIPILGPDGQPSQTPEAIIAAFTNFGTHEAITRLLYESQLVP